VSEFPVVFLAGFHGGKRPILPRARTRAWEAAVCKLWHVFAEDRRLTGAGYIEVKISYPKRISQMAKYRRVWNANRLSYWVCWMKGLAVKAGNNCRVDEFKRRLPWSYFIARIFSPLPNVLAPTLNATKTGCIILELRFQSGVNLVSLPVFLVEKADNDSLPMIHRWLKNLNVHWFQKKLFASSLSMWKIEFNTTCKILR
jgi:hypothetical protein